MRDVLFSLVENNHFESDPQFFLVPLNSFLIERIQDLYSTFKCMRRGYDGACHILFMLECGQEAWATDFELDNRYWFERHNPHGFHRPPPVEIFDSEQIGNILYVKTGIITYVQFTNNLQQLRFHAYTPQSALLKHCTHAVYLSHFGIDPVHPDQMVLFKNTEYPTLLGEEI